MSQTAAITSMMFMFMSPAILVGALCLYETVFGSSQGRPVLVHVNSPLTNREEWREMKRMKGPRP